MARRRQGYGYGGGYTTGTGAGIQRPYAHMQRYDPWADAASDIAKAITTISEDAADQEQRDRVFNRTILTSLGNIDANASADQIDHRMGSIEKINAKETDETLKAYGVALLSEMEGLKTTLLVKEEYDNRFNETHDALDKLEDRIRETGDYGGGSDVRALFTKLEDSYGANVDNFSAAQRSFYNQQLKEMDTRSSVLSALELLDTDKELRGVQLDPNKYTEASQSLVDQASLLADTGQYKYAQRTMYQMGGVESRAAKQEENPLRSSVIENRRLVKDAFGGTDNPDLKAILSNVHQIAKGSSLSRNISPDVIAKQKEETAEAMMKFVGYQYAGLFGNYPENIETVDADGNASSHRFGDIMRGWEQGLITADDAISQIMGAFNATIVDGRAVMPGKKGQGRTASDRTVSGSEWARHVGGDEYLTKTLQDLYEFYISLDNYEASLRGSTNQSPASAGMDALGGSRSNVSSWED